MVMKWDPIVMSDPSKFRVGDVVKILHGDFFPVPWYRRLWLRLFSPRMVVTRVNYQTGEISVTTRMWWQRW